MRAAVAGITVGVTTLLGVTFQGSGAQPAEGTSQTGRRPGVAICVQAVGTDRSVEARAKAAVEVALVGVRKHPYWVPSGRGAAPPVVDIGCPSGPAPERGPAFPVPLMNIVGHEVSTPSFYRLFVFIVPRAELDRLSAGSGMREANQEAICEGDVCRGVTTALYITPEELQDAELMVDVLTRGIGLE